MDDAAPATDQDDGTPAAADVPTILDRAAAIHRAGTDDESYDRIWSVLEALRPFGRAAFEAATARLGSGDPSVRATACDALTALCNPDEDGWSAEKAAAVLALAEHEEDDDVLWSILVALPFADAEAFDVLDRLKGHHRRDIRLAVTRALTTASEGADPVALIGALATLMDDADGEIRDWATFGLGRMTDLDGADVRAALTRRLDDPYGDARDEAILGLARRRDRRMVPVLVARFTEEWVHALAVEAAAYLADPALVEPLCELEDWWTVDPELLQEAIDACDPDQQAAALVTMVEVHTRLDAALADRPGVHAVLSCDRFERGITLALGPEAPGGYHYDLDRFLRRCHGDLDVVVRTIVSDRDEA